MPYMMPLRFVVIDSGLTFTFRISDRRNCKREKGINIQILGGNSNCTLLINSKMPIDIVFG